MRRTWRRLVLSGAVGLTVSCQSNVIEPDGPIAGTLTVSLATPNVDDAALIVTITGPAAPTSIVAADAGVQLFQGTAPGTTTTVVLTGDMRDGPILSIAVPDVKRVARYRATIGQAASTTYVLRPLAGYALTVSRQ